MPAVMMRSWPRAMRAPAAIFTSNRRVMYSETSRRKTTSAVNILREIVLPHVGPTSCSLISLTEIPAVRARAVRSWSPLRDEPVAGEAVGLGDPEALAVGVAVGVGVADAVGVGVAPLAVGEGVAVGVGLGVAGVSPSWVKLLVLMSTVLLPTISTLASPRPNLDMIAW